MPSELTYIEAEALATFVDEDGYTVELIEDYTQRFQEKYKNFPSSIIQQWFYEHRETIHRYSWLDYSSMEFELTSMTTKSLQQTCLSKNPTIAQYQLHFETNNTSIRMARIADYICKFGTWPIPPILLTNLNEKVLFPCGSPCDSPLHLLEGHHRFAVFLAFAKSGSIKDQHQVWIAYTKNSN